MCAYYGTQEEIIKMPDYVDYYDRTIQNHSAGFKLVGGGTGLGKTSAIRKLITLPAYQDRKFIYCANRKQLLEEMAQELKSTQPPGSPACYVMLRRGGGARYTQEPSECFLRLARSAHLSGQPEPLERQVSTQAG